MCIPKKSDTNSNHTKCFPSPTKYPDPSKLYSYFGDLGTPREQVHHSIEGSSNPLCLWVGWNLPCLPCQVSQVTWSAWDPAGGVSYKCEISTSVTRKKKTQFIGIHREKVTWKNECFFRGKQIGTQTLHVQFLNSWPETEGRGTSKKQCEEVLHLTRKDFLYNVTVNFLTGPWHDLRFKVTQWILRIFWWHFILSCSLARKLPIPFWVGCQRCFSELGVCSPVTKIELAWIQQQ